MIKHLSLYKTVQLKHKIKSCNNLEILNISLVKKIAAFSLVFISCITTVYASGYYNSEDSGFFINSSIGVANTRSSINDPGVTFNRVKSFSRKNGFAANFGAGYKWSFGEKESWNQFYTGVSANYYYFGSVIDPKASVGYFNVIQTKSSPLTTLDIETFIGKYLLSPISIQFGYGIGTSTLGSDNSVDPLVKLKLGYDITQHLQAYITYIGMEYDSDLGFLNGEQTVIINSGQIGLEYKF